MSFTYDKAKDIADRLGCDPAVVLAVAEVESGGRHDLPDGRPQILFEAHWFSKLTKGRFDERFPTLSSPVWNRALYKGGTQEWDRLNVAISLDEDAALQSASWGLFQIMGFNFKACGFDSVKAFVDFIKGPDDADMEAFVNFVKANPKILAAMKAKDWQAFALNYNGPGAVASYSAKMADAFARHRGAPDREEVGPPIPVADPTLPAKNPMTSKEVLTTGGGAVATATIIVSNAKPAIDAVSSTADTIKQASSALAGLKDALAVFDNGHVLTVALLLVALAGLGYLAWRFIRAARRGDLVVR